jgi:maltose-binding protein MalE
MFQKIVLSICVGILLATTPTVVDANKSHSYSNYVSNKSSKNAIDVSKISIGSIKLGMKEKDITKILGKPKSKTIKYDDVCYGSYITTWKYNELEIEGLSTTNNSNKSQVHMIITSTSRYPTERGVKVGDNISKAQKAYSNLLSKFERGEGFDNLAYSNDAYGGLVFSSNKQRVIRKIRLVAASC